MPDGTQTETYPISATRTRQAVNLGDHAQDITDALLVPADMTVAQLVTLGLTRQERNGARTVEPESYLTIRIAQPIHEPEPVDPEATPF